MLYAGLPWTMTNFAVWAQNAIYIAKVTEYSILPEVFSAKR